MMMEKKDVLDKKQEVYESMTIDYQGEKLRVADIADKSLSFDEYKEAEMNGYVRDSIYPKLNNEALTEVAAEYKSRCTEPLKPVTTYNDALIHLVVPEMIERIRELEVLLKGKSERQEEFQ